MEFVGAELKFPAIVVAPELVTPAPPNTAKLSAVAPNSGVADAGKHQTSDNIKPNRDMMKYRTFTGLFIRAGAKSTGLVA